ncbi:MAG: ImmA/IrrE family metallo-endopeptidase [Actinobacteria bacterium]|nr:ImmA/IrrE family metallo-endopeptidase [Actinomycetota bacterium]
MSTAAAGTVAGGNEAKVCPSSEAALEVVGMRAEAKIKKEAAEDAARILRATFRVRAPVDPIAIAQELGIQVLEGELDRDRLGGLVMEPGAEPKIYMNQLDLLIRRRFTCAVELGHYVRRSADTNRYGRVDRRSDRPKSERDPESVYAEEFASCLLMPDLDVKVMTELGVDDLEMALRFQVSRELVQLRLNDLGLRTADLLEP